MIPLLKFGAAWLLPPGLFVVLLGALSVKLFKIDKRLALATALCTIIFYLLCTSFLAERLTGWLERKYLPPTQHEVTGADVIIVLGGGVIAQVPDVDGSGSLGASSANRLLTAVRLQRLLNVPIIVSGGQVSSDTEAEAEICARILKSLGVPETKILLETQSLNTAQNALHCAEILRERSFKAPLLVTSAFHMNRAMLNFKLCNVEPLAYPTDFTVANDTAFRYTQLRPQAEALYLNATFMQEVLRTFITEVFGI